MDPESPPQNLPESVPIPLVWVAADDERVLFANQFLVQENLGTFFLSVGQLIPPPLLGTPEERYEEARSIPFIPIKTMSRFSMTRRSIAELIEVLTIVINNYDQREGKEET